MAIVATVSNHGKFQFASGNIDLANDSLKVILMNSTFTFDKDAHATLADVTADQLPTGSGYTQDSKVLANPVLVEDDTNDKAAFTCDDPTWTAAGGNIGLAGGACIYDDTTADDTVIAGIDFGVDYLVLDGSSIQLQNIAISLT